MLKRLCRPLLKNSFFLFGARGSGKSTLLKSLFKTTPHVWINLLNPNTEDALAKNPMSVIEEWLALSTPRPKWIVIDEVQKLPQLLNVVHLGIEEYKIRFALTGSSSRKLKREGVNLLAGRAWVNHLYPLSTLEMKNNFRLDDALNWGSLPGLLSLKQDAHRREFLKSYTQTYLREEIRLEQLVHDIEPFRQFLDIAAQCNGKILNFSTIARQIGADHKTVKKYFDILADTWLGFYLESYHPSVRKRQTQKPKFYWFDNGVQRSLEGSITSPLVASTSVYGQAFEQWVILECHRYNAYLRRDFKFSYLRTKDDAEIDLIIERPGDTVILAEIKSTKNVDTKTINQLRALNQNIKNSTPMILSQEKNPRLVEGVWVGPWDKGINRIFGIK